MYGSGKGVSRSAHGNRPFRDALERSRSASSEAEPPPEAGGRTGFGKPTQPTPRGPVETNRICARNAGRASLVTSFTLLAGFLVVTFSTFATLRQFGLLSAVSLASCLAANLFPAACDPAALSV